MVTAAYKWAEMLGAGRGALCVRIPPCPVCLLRLMEKKKKPGANHLDAGLNSTLQPRIAFHSWASSLHLPSPGVTATSLAFHFWFGFVLFGEVSLLHSPGWSGTLCIAQAVPELLP